MSVRCGHLLHGIESVKRLRIQELRVTGIPASVWEIRVKIQVHIAVNRDLWNPRSVKPTDARTCQNALKELRDVTRTESGTRVRSFRSISGLQSRTAFPITCKNNSYNPLKHVTLLTRETEILNKSRLMIPTRVRIDVRWMTALHVTNPLHINTHNNTLRELRESTVVMKALKRVNKYMRLKTSERLALFQLISALLVHELQEPQSSRNHGSDSRGGTRSDITHNIKRCVLQMTLFYKHTGIKIYRKYTQLKREDCKHHY